MGLGFLIALKQAEEIINNLIEYCNEHGGEVFLSQKGGNQFGTVLKEPISINYFTTINYGKRSDE